MIMFVILYTHSTLVKLMEPTAFHPLFYLCVLSIFLLSWCVSFASFSKLIHFRTLGNTLSCFLFQKKALVLIPRTIAQSLCLLSLLRFLNHYSITTSFPILNLFLYFLTLSSVSAKVVPLLTYLPYSPINGLLL